MENTVRLNDQELIEIAWEAVREFFSPEAVQTSSIEVRHSVNAPADMVDENDKTTASVWFVHENKDEDFHPMQITRANMRAWDLMRVRGDTRYVSFYHSYKSDPRATKQAA